MNKYESRDERHKFMVNRFREFISGSIANIGGGGKKHLLTYINLEKYVEIDIDGNPDIKINLDKDFPLPIDDNIYDTVICTDVLEHLEELHRTVKEIIRITKKYVIISVPNALLNITSYLRRKKYIGDSGIAGIDVGYFSKYYGLPIKRPKDRHRWFFSYTEAKKFFNDVSSDLGFKIVNEYAVGSQGLSIRNKIISFLIKIFFGKELMMDLFYSAYWCVLEKK